MTCRANLASQGLFCGAKRCKAVQSLYSSSDNQLDDFASPAKNNVQSSQRTPSVSQKNLDNYFDHSSQQKVGSQTVQRASKASQNIETYLNQSSQQKVGTQSDLRSPNTSQSKLDTYLNQDSQQGVGTQSPQRALNTSRTSQQKTDSASYPRISNTSQNNLDSDLPQDTEQKIQSNQRLLETSQNKLNTYLKQNSQQKVGSQTFRRSQNNLDTFADTQQQKRFQLPPSQPQAVYMETAAPRTVNADRLNMTESKILNTLRSVRTPIVNYQETRGVPRTAQVSFINLVTSLCTHAYTAAITILVMLWNLAPLLDGFVYFARFAVDKLIDIFETEDHKEKAMKMAVFAGEIIIIFFLIFLIVGLIFMPVYVLTARIVSKIWGMIRW